jgi:tRNA G18 (ribose-2'-O)-methylase SpoU
MKPLKEVYLILDNIRSAENVGAIFRTVDAVGVKKVYLCGITPRPPQSQISKTALAAADSIEWEYQEDIVNILRKLKIAKIKIVALEQTNKSDDYHQIKFKARVAIIVGNEINGINQEVLTKADQIIELPMYGRGKSLNVATATGIVLYSLL